MMANQNAFEDLMRMKQDLKHKNEELANSRLESQKLQKVLVFKITIRSN